MLEAKKYSASGEQQGSVALPESLFGVQLSTANAVLYEVINMYRANQRQGNAKAKTRGEVAGSTRKLFRQKGSGGARPGSRKSPLRRGGGVVFGPIPKDWVRHIPIKKKRLALKLALSERARNGQVMIIEDFSFDSYNTRRAVDLLAKIAPGHERKLVIIDGSEPTIVRSFTNIPRVEMNRADSLFAYEVLKSKCLILTQSALKKVEEVFAK